jgi:hypothetical protein
MRQHGKALAKENPMFRKLFLDHPKEVNETYFQHFGVASRFGLRMIIGGIGGLIHAFIPALCKTKGSETVDALHAQLIRNRAATRDQKSIEWNI